MLTVIGTCIAGVGFATTLSSKSLKRWLMSVVVRTWSALSRFSMIVSFCLSSFNSL
jgi:hypothetical protein